MFQPATGMRHARFLDTLHATHVFDWYMEIGCRTGRTFIPSRSKTIAVDPFFQVTSNAIGKKPALHVVQTTSDDFFAGGFLDRMGIRLSFTFIDGMHLFEFLLRDFINTERHSDPKGVIAIHDCCPFTLRMTTRDLDNLPGGAWTGDVWKMLPVLRKYRPDLTVTVADCRPSGLVLVSGLDPKNRVLEKAYDKIVAEWVPVDLGDYGVGRHFGGFGYTSARGIVADGFPMFRDVKLGEDLPATPALALH